MSTPRDESSGRAEREAAVIYLGKVERCEIGGFHAIGPRGGPPLAYVFGRDDADRIVAALASVETEAGVGEAPSRCIAGCHLDVPTGVMWHSPFCPVSLFGPASPATEGGEDHDSGEAISADVEAPSAEPATGRDRSQDAPEREVPSAGGAPAYSDEADEDDGWAMIKAWSREEADGHRESMIQCHRDVGATATFNEEPGETERFAATVHVCALVPVGATPSAPAPRTDPTSSQTEAGMSSPAPDASQPSAIGGGSARASSVAAPAPEVEQAYVDSLHRQLDTKRAQMAHDRLKIDGLEKQVERLRQALTLCAEWFDGYAASHRAKGADEKAARNEERAGFCYRALASTPETPRATPRRTE
jgi:hypothetical protein